MGELKNEKEEENARNPTQIGTQALSNRSDEKATKQWPEEKSDDLCSTWHLTRKQFDPRSRDHDKNRFHFLDPTL